MKGRTEVQEEQSDIGVLALQVCKGQVNHRYCKMASHLAAGTGVVGQVLPTESPVLTLDEPLSPNLAKYKMI